MQLEVTAESATLSYWLNWRVLPCSIWVLTPMVIASLIIWKYEGSNKLKSERGEVHQDLDQPLYDSEAWRPCLKQIHPIWLLAFRLVAFFLLLATLVFKVFKNGGLVFYYYTQWTFTLLTIYFGCGTLLSVYGCYYQYITLKSSGVSSHVGTDTEQGSYMPLMCEETTNIFRKRNLSNPQKENYAFRLPRIWTYVFEIIFQMSAGAVMLTDSVYWFIIFPFLTIKDYNLSFLTVDMHTFNLILLLGDTALNCLIPLYRISFFVLWTGVFVIFQWIVHACISIWWPYPFLDLSLPYAPLWYLLIAIMHIPCYGVFVLIVETKRHLLTKWFPFSYQC